MKKAQVLSVIALAFALGLVVTPIASVSAASPIWSINANNTATGTADTTDVEAAITAVEADENYARILAFDAEVKKVTATDLGAGKTVATLKKDLKNKYDNVEASDANTLLTGLQTDLVAADAGANVTAFAAPKIGATNVTPENFEAAVSAAKNAEFYDAYHDLIVAIEDEHQTGLSAAIEGFNAAKGLHGSSTPQSFGTSSDDLKLYKSLTNNPIYNAQKPDTTYYYRTEFNNYVTLNTTIEKLEVIYNSYKAGLDNLIIVTDALDQAGQLTEDGSDGYDYTKNMNWPTINNVNMLINGGTLAGITVPGPMIINYNAWAAVTAAINAAKPYKTATTVARYTMIYNIARAYRNATWDLYKNQSVAEVAEILVNYKAASKPQGPTTGDNGDQQGTDNGTDTAAPNTGALLNSDNGATTVSVVAGLATALTALGAGVVAYRNARRSSRK